MANLADNFKRLTVLLKWIELLIAIADIALLQQFGTYPGIGIYRTAVIYTALCGYILILPVLLVGANLKQEVSKLLVVIWLVVASFLWMAAGALMFETFTIIPEGHFVSGALIGSGVLTFLNGCIFIADVIFTYRED